MIWFMKPKWGYLKCHPGFPEASVLRFWQLVVPWVQMYASLFRHTVTLSDSPSPHPDPHYSAAHLSSFPFPPPKASIHPHICFSLGLHVSKDLNNLNAGTSAVSLWHLTQHLGDLKGRGENYRKWCVTKIKNRPRLPPITLNNPVQSICWSDGGLLHLLGNNYNSKSENRKASLRETATYNNKMMRLDLFSTVLYGVECFVW